MYNHVAAVEGQSSIGVLQELFRRVGVRPKGLRDASRKPALREKRAHPGT